MNPEHINMNDTTPILTADGLQHAPDTDTFSEQPKPYVGRDAKGNLVIMLDGKVVGTLQKAQKMSYAKGLESKFQAKRKQAYLDKQAKQQAN